ncbi:MAG: hypothetical protein HY695_34355 [Deltaproteobacteria bacterium]|nr:hypothetical protein [Deltaproteobacteria bacterium]
MNKGRSYFEFLDQFKRAGCPMCSFLVKDSHGFLDHLLYESVLDVPIRMELMQSFGFCSWHTWQLPALPSICSPDTGYSIFASDLLRKFAYLSSSVEEGIGKKRTLKSFLAKSRRRWLSRVKQKACPACRHVSQFETYHLKELLEFIGDEEFLEAYKASSGICLPHFFLVQERYSGHGNFPLLLEAQRAMAQSLRNTLEEFIRKQDYRFRDEITSTEARAWRVAMEFVAGKPGVFTNEMGHDRVRTTRTGGISADRVSVQSTAFDRCSLAQLIEQMKGSKEATFYLKQALPQDLLGGLRDLASQKIHLSVEFVVEELGNVEYLRTLYSLGFSLLYGIGLPAQTVVLLDGKRGYMLDDHQRSSGRRLRPLKNAEDLYLNLLWRRFGIAVLLSGSIKEVDIKSGLFCLATEGSREQWCRFKKADTNELPQVGSNVEVFGWERWNTRVVELLDVYPIRRE